MKRDLAFISCNLSLRNSDRITALILMIFVLFSLQVFSQSVHPEPVTLAIGSKAPDFRLQGVDGKIYSLGDYSAAKVLVVIFSCNHCPTAQAYEGRIIDLAREYKNKGVAVLMISSNDIKALNYGELGYSDMGDSFEDMVIRARDKGYNFPYLYDGDDQKAALAFGPVATPHCFVFDQNRILRYTGRIDSQEKQGVGKAEDIRNAVEAVLSGRKIKTPVTKVFGCSIKWSWKSELTEKLYKQWAAMPVSVEEIDEAGVKDLLRNNPSDKLRMINIWATWCGPCVTEFPELIIIDRMYRRRPFEFITISADKMPKKNEVLKFLKDHEASNKNYIFNGKSVYELVDAIGQNWQGEIPFTILIEPGGKVIYSSQGIINPLELKRRIVDHKLIGRYY